MGALDFIANSCTISSIGLFLTGTSICLKIIRDGSTGAISSLPFVTTLTNCLIGIVYGILKSNANILFVNLVGTVFEAVYTLVFLYYVFDRRKLINQILFITVFLSGVSFYALYYEDNGDKAAFFIGVVSNVVCIVVYAAPLATLKHIINSRSTESLSSALLLANFISAILWFTYGFMLDDVFILLPNVFGLILCLAQLSLFYIYPSNSSVKTSTKTD